MPNAPRTPGRNVRVHDDVWAASQARAAELASADVDQRSVELVVHVDDASSVTAVVVAALEAFAGVATPDEPRRPPRRHAEPPTTT